MTQITVGKAWNNSEKLVDRSGLIIGRIAGIGFGITTQCLFLYTVVFLFYFLRYGGGTPFRYWWLADALLAVGFAVPHSILLVPAVQRQLKKYVPVGLLGCIHCTVTCLTLLCMFKFWGHSDFIIWSTGGLAKSMVLICFYGSWVALFYSLWLVGMGYQTGLTQWWYWLVRQKPPVRPFVTKGAFQWMRHPVYMSFLGLIWFTPVMTMDHLILTTIWTAYIYAGSYFKDKRLLYFIGQPYRQYASQVVGLPIIGFGPLRKIKFESPNQIG